MNIRLNQDVIDLLKSLTNLEKSPPKITIDLAMNLMKRLFGTTNISNSEDDPIETVIINSEVSLEAELRLRLESSTHQPSRNDRYNKLRQEFRLLNYHHIS